jgi:hypothetical protein
MTAKSEVHNEEDGGFIFDRTDGKDEEEVNIEEI